MKVEYNPDLALRNIEEYRKGNRKIEECIPDKLEENRIYEFLKEGQRNYWLEGEQPLLETKGSQLLSRPKASITILEITHFMKDDKIFTKGKYKIVKIFNAKDIYFEGFQKVNEHKE